MTSRRDVTPCNMIKEQSYNTSAVLRIRFVSDADLAKLKNIAIISSISYSSLQLLEDFFMCHFDSKEFCPYFSARSDPDRLFGKGPYLSCSGVYSRGSTGL